MIVLGIGGFEGSADPAERRPLPSTAGSVEELLRFSAGGIPLQFFPLNLIGHDSSASLLVDGQLVASASEERFTRIKHGYNLLGETVMPRRAIAYCMEEAGVSWDEIDLVAHYCRFSDRSVAARLERVSRGLDSARRVILGGAYEAAFRDRLSRQAVLAQLEALAGRSIPDGKLIQVRHHLAHAAGAFFSSRFDRALILTLDGYGEEESSIWAIGDGRQIQAKGSTRLPHSLGVLYQVITAYLGFSSFGDEYKVMGLSSFGDPSVFKPVFEQLVELLPDGGYRIDRLASLRLFQWLEEHLGPPGNGEKERRSVDIAAALQQRLQEAVLHHLSHLRTRYPIRRLCLSGGVALNARVNRAILESGLFDEVFFQPAAGDDGASLGAALWAHHHRCPAESRQPIDHVFWGPRYSPAQIEASLGRCDSVVWTREESIVETTVRLLAEGKVIGWFQGRMEMGPRALGARSILADPRSETVRDRINHMVKRREPFRPFAPSVLEDQAGQFFQLAGTPTAPYMLVTFETHEQQRGLIPAVVHIDGSARIQTVSAKANPRYHALIERFFQETGVPVLLNTSFNRAGEPIVNSPDDAIGCLLRSGLDALVMGDYLVFPEQ